MATTFFLYPMSPNRAYDANGDPAPGALAYFYEAGTSTPLTVYSDTALSTAHVSPIVADADGYFAPVYVSGPDEVKVVVKDASDATLWTQDYVTGIPVGGLDAASIPFAATSRISETDAQAAVEAVDAEVRRLELAGSLIPATGSMNAYALVSGIVGYAAYAHGDTFLFTPSVGNTGACTLNVDGIGAKPIKTGTASGSANLTSGDIHLRDVLRVVYDSTEDAFLIVGQFRRRALQAEAEAGVAEGLMMDPLRTAQAIAALAPAALGAGIKAWVSFNASTGVPAVNGSLNVASISDNGVGDYTVNFSDAMPDANYAAVATAGDLNTGAVSNISITGKLAGSLRIQINNNSAAATDREEVSVAVIA